MRKIIFLPIAFSLALAGARAANWAAPDDTVRQLFQRPPDVSLPDTSPLAAQRVRLGERLFYDPILSGSHKLSCASCHIQSLSWENGQAFALGDAHRKLPHRAPTLLDLRWVAPLGWDGKFNSLEDMVMAPVLSKDIMNVPEAELLSRLRADPTYVDLFRQAFPDHTVNKANTASALAAFVRTIVSGEAPFDRWLGGETDAISASAKRGFVIFNTKGHCSQCHSGWTFSDGSFHDIGTETGQDRGRGKLFPTSIKLQYAFKTPTLRDVARRGPYMHNGSLPTLEAVIEHYNEGGVARPSRAEFIGPLGLGQSEKDDLLAFLKTLTTTKDNLEKVARPESR